VREAGQNSLALFPEVELWSAARELALTPHRAEEVEEIGFLSAQSEHEGERSTGHSPDFWRRVVVSGVDPCPSMSTGSIACELVPLNLGVTSRVRRDEGQAVIVRWPRFWQRRGSPGLTSTCQARA